MMLYGIYSARNHYKNTRWLQDCTLSQANQSASVMALSSSKTVQGVQNLVKAVEIVNAYVKGVQQLDEDFTKHPEFKDYKDHVEEAKANASMWQNELYPLYKSTTSGILQASQFFSQTIRNLQNSIKTKYDEKKFEQELNKLITAATSQQSKIAEVIDKINKFSEEEAKNIKNFHFDANKVRVTITGYQGDLKSLQNELGGIEKSIVKDKALFAGTIIFPWIAIAAGVSLKKDQDKKSHVEGEISDKNTEITNFTNFKVHLDHLNVAGQSLSQAISQIQEGWDSLGADIHEVIGKLQVLSTTAAVDYLRPLLDSAYRDWTDVVELAKQL